MFHLSLSLSIVVRWVVKSYRLELLIWSCEKLNADLSRKKEKLAESDQSVTIIDYIRSQGFLVLCCCWKKSRLNERFVGIAYMHAAFCDHTAHSWKTRRLLLQIFFFPFHLSADEKNETLINRHLHLRRETRSSQAAWRILPVNNKSVSIRLSNS